VGFNLVLLVNENRSSHLAQASLLWITSWRLVTYIPNRFVFYWPETMVLRENGPDIVLIGAFSPAIDSTR